MSMDRRRFLQVSAVGGGMVIGVSLGCKPSPEERFGQKEAPARDDKGGQPGPEQKPAGEPATLNAWVRIAPDDTITFWINESEMGQGILTSLAMILAEDLEADWAKVRAEHAPVNEAAYGRQGTGGSNSVRTNYEKLRVAGAAARDMLIGAAAKRWGVDPGECRAKDSAVVHEASGRRLGYGELAGEAASMAVPENPALKERSSFRLIGKPVKRLDTPAKVNGSAVFGMDVKRPGLVVAQVVHSPFFGGKVASFDASRAEKVPGVHKILEIPTGVAVVAENFWAAKKARDLVQIQWDTDGAEKLSGAGLMESLRKAAPKGKVARQDGNAAAIAARAARDKRSLTAVYTVPYLAHAPMEPLNCTAEVSADRCELWVPTQGPTGAQQVAATITGLPADKVFVNTTLLGGGFGRRAQTDFVADAVHIAKEVGRPVKVIWTREDDIRGGFYRPMAYNEFTGALDANGWPVAWIHRIASPSILDAFGPLKDGIDGTSVEGAANLPYAIDHVLVSWANLQTPIPTWFWRSVGSSQNGYVTECFVDELARLGQKDPLELRRRLLANSPRHLRVLETAADRAGWGSPLPPGRARGIAVHESFGSFVAQVAEVSVTGSAVRVHRVVCAVDCGDVINPNTVEAQMESSIAYGLTAALYGKIDISGGAAVQSNFHDYPVLRMPEMPAVETHIVATGDPLGGVGEPGLPPIAPAVCNGLLALTGKPVRSLPITLS